MAASETAVLSSQSTGWLAGFLAVLTQTGDVFDKSPILGFVCMGLLGAFAGFGLLMEQGKYDEQPSSRQVRSLCMRLGIGLVIGVGAGVLWADTDGTSKGMWMLVTGVVASAPIDMWKVAVEVLGTLLRKKAEK